MMQTGQRRKFFFKLFNSVLFYLKPAIVIMIRPQSYLKGNKTYLREEEELKT